MSASYLTDSKVFDGRLLSMAEMLHFMQGHQDTSATLLLNLLVTGHITAFIRISNEIVAQGYIKESAAVAGTLLVNR